MKTIIYTPTPHFDASAHLEPVDFDAAMARGAVALRGMVERASLPEILGVKLHAPMDEVGEAFRERVRRLSFTFGVPHLTRDLKALEATFAALKEAAEIMLDDERRAEYIRRSEEVGHLLSYEENTLDTVEVESVVEPLAFRPAEDIRDTPPKNTARTLTRILLASVLVLMNVAIYLLIGHMLASAL